MSPVLVQHLQDVGPQNVIDFTGLDFANNIKYQVEIRGIYPVTLDAAILTAGVGYGGVIDGDPLCNGLGGSANFQKWRLSERYAPASAIAPSWPGGMVCSQDMIGTENPAVENEGVFRGGSGRITLYGGDADLTAPGIEVALRYRDGNGELETTWLLGDFFKKRAGAPLDTFRLRYVPRTGTAAIPIRARRIAVYRWPLS